MRSLQTVNRRKQCTYAPKILICAHRQGPETRFFGFPSVNSVSDPIKHYSIKHP